jgi:hypothetical protein
MASRLDKFKNLAGLHGAVPPGLPTQAADTAVLQMSLKDGFGSRPGERS